MIKFSPFFPFQHTLNNLMTSGKMVILIHNLRKWYIYIWGEHRWPHGSMSMWLELLKQQGVESGGKEWRYLSGISHFYFMFILRPKFVEWYCSHSFMVALHTKQQFFSSILLVSSAIRYHAMIKWLLLVEGKMKSIYHIIIFC